MARFDRYNEACEATDPGHVAHYLGMIGIRPDAQGRGIGRQIDAVKARARSDPESTGITLNTECESNLPFYEKVGFLKGSEADVGPSIPGRSTGPGIPPLLLAWRVLHDVLLHYLPERLPSGERFHKVV